MTTDWLKDAPITEEDADFAEEHSRLTVDDFPAGFEPTP